MSIHKNAVLGATLFASSMLAQDLTPQQLKAACETSPANTVIVNSPLKVANFGNRVNVTTGCRLVFGATAKFEADSINMGFAGPLVFQGGAKSGAVLVKTLLEAPSITLDFAGGDNFVELAESTVRGTTGNVVINSGQSSKLVVASRFAGRAQAILAAGSIQVAGAGKFDVSLSDTTVSGNAGVNVSGSGAEMTVAIGNSSVISTLGAVNIASPGTQATLDWAQGQLRGRTGVSVTFSGNEGQLALQTVTVNAGLGSAAFITALSGARPAKSIVLGSNIAAGGSVNIVASELGQSGEAALESSRVSATGAVIVRSGPLGTTNVKINTLNSGVLVGAYTGPSGSCTAEGNAVASPAQALCLP